MGTVFGVVHLLPLPGSPGHRKGMDEILARAVRDARSYARGGVDALFVENYGDAPFFKESLPPETVAAMTRCAGAVKEAVRLPIGINALRNDARAALGIAAAVGADFIRVNVHAGIVATDQGLIEGRAAETLRTRAALGLDAKILADVHVKHGSPLFSPGLVAAARDLVERAGADGVILSGHSTGVSADLEELRTLREALPGAYLLVGSGARKETVASLLRYADAVIVGTSLKRGGRTTNEVETARVKAFVRAARAATRQGRRRR